ncbi:MAG TPA: thioredoxin domain-containing protein [Pilimelia sp.]|nr:thioredoxin domain-containing protein [Pilimelia sp.]
MSTKRPASKAIAAQLAAERRRQRVLWGSLIAVVVLLLAGIIGYGVYAGQKDEQVNVPKNTATGDDTGIARGSGKVRVDVYLDYMCPACRQFDEAAGPSLDKLVNDGTATLVVHPIAILDRYSQGTNFSSRAAAAAGCAADSGKFTEFTDAMYARQPDENTPGLTDDQIIDIGRGVGLGDGFASCVRDRTYRGWATHVTDTAGARDVNATPTVLVNGKKIDSDPTKIAAAVTAAAAS